MTPDQYWPYVVVAVILIAVVICTVSMAARISRQDVERARHEQREGGPAQEKDELL